MNGFTLQFGSLNSDDKYRPALKIYHPADALEHLRECIRQTMEVFPHLTYRQALTIERTKLAYFAGYYGVDTRVRIEALYQCVHPYAGEAKECHRGRSIQLGGDFAKLCIVWDSQPLSALCFGRFKQPEWKALVYK